MRRLLFLGLVTILGLAALNCGGDGAESPSPTRPAASATAQPTAPAAGSPQARACPVAQEICTFAATVNRAVLSSNINALVSDVRLQSYTCPAIRPQGLGGPYPLCDSTPGQVRQGFRVTVLASEGEVVDLAGLRDFTERWIRSAVPAASDKYGNGANRIFTVACPAGIVACSTQQFALVFSNLQSTTPNSPRSQMILFFEQQAGGSISLVLAVFGPLLQPGEEAAALNGGTTQNFIGPDSWPKATTTFYPIRP